MEKVIFTDKQRIVHALIMKALNCKSIGLFDGKMGVAIAFYHYYRHTGNHVYEQYANALLDSVLDGVTREADTSMATGLCGIGWGIDYILQNGFAEGDSMEVCQQIDERIMLYDPKRMSDNALEDLIHYILIHCKNGMPFDVQYISDIESAVFERHQAPFLITNQANCYEVDIMNFVESVDISDGVFHTKPIGLHGGLAGVLMQKYVVL